MNRIWFLSVALSILVPSAVLAVPEAKYKVVDKKGNIEIREYAPQILAETIVTDSIENAGNVAFRRLFKYISGENSQTNKIAMTAPVSQQATGEEITMTAPVTQQGSGTNWAVSFMMPQSYTIQTLPRPLNDNIKLREIPSRRIAAIRYSGFWSEQRYNKHLKLLQEWIGNNGLTPCGDPIWARYNPPFMPWFLRRNEVLIPVK